MVFSPCLFNISILQYKQYLSNLQAKEWKIVMLSLNEGEEKLDNVKVMQLILTEEMVAKFLSSISQFIMTFLISWTFSLLFE